LFFTGGQMAACEEYVKKPEKFLAAAQNFSA
jgi:hypothetical protein